jgi:hypothetical protein
MTCQHCGRRPANRPRQLCWTCYYAPGVKDQYAPLSSHREGLGLRSPSGLPRPTSIAPGPRKVSILCARAELGFELWHPDDFVLGQEDTLSCEEQYALRESVERDGFCHAVA